MTPGPSLKTTPPSRGLQGNLTNVWLEKLRIWTRLALDLAPRGAFLAVSNPKVLKNYRRLAMPILLTTAVTQFVAFVLVLPVRILLVLLWALSLGTLPGLDAAHGGLDAVGREALYMSPLLVMLLFRTIYKNSISKCFFQILEDVNPSEGARVKDLKPLPKNATSASSQAMKRKEPADPWGRLCSWAVWVWSNKPLALMLINIAVRLGSRSEIIGFLAAPASTFVVLAGRMRRPYAAVITLLCMIPFMRPLAIRGSEIFRGSVVLSNELIEPYVSRSIPHNKRKAFLKNHEAAIFFFGVPFYILMNIKFVGPTTFILAQAAAAVLCDHIAQEIDMHKQEAAERDDESRMSEILDEEPMLGISPLHGSHNYKAKSAEKAD